MAGENLQERKRISEIYARAFYDLTAQQGMTDIVLEQLNLLDELLRGEPLLYQVFSSTLVTMDERDAILKKLGGSLEPVLQSFLSVMNRRNRLGLLPEVIQAYSKEDFDRKNKIQVSLYTASPVDKNMMDEIVSILREYLLKEPIVSYQVRPELLGGFVAKAGDFLIDGSVRTKIKELQKQLIMRGEDEIQG
jgi:F-type H+-transporting ATPase subunit delta